MGFWSKAKAADSTYSVVSWVPTITQVLFPSTWALVVGFAATYRDWIWNDYGMLGVLLVGLCAAVIASFAYALVGVGFRAWRGSPTPKPDIERPSTTVAQVHAVGLLDEAEPARNRSPPATFPLLVPGRFYSTAEKERIVDTMNLIQRGFTAGRAMRREAREVSANPGHNAELDSSIKRIQALHSGAERLNNEFDIVRNESHSYPVDFSVLLAAKPVYSEEFQRALYDYANALIVYRHFASDSGEHRGSLAKVIDAQKRHLSRADHHFGEWIDKCDEQIRSARRVLEK
jgi:hypothetical protein